MIDLLLPFHGDPDLMRQTVRSVQAQRSDGWRLVVVDDAYPDASVRTWFERLGDPRVEYHRNERNLGANANYRRAVELVTASHVCVLGADDLLMPDFLPVVEGVLATAPGVGVVQCGVRVIDGAGDPVDPLVDRVKGWLRPRSADLSVLAGEQLLVSLLRGNWTYFPSLVWRTDLVRQAGFRPEYDVVQDLALLVDVVRAGGSMALVPDEVFRYRRHAASDSSRRTLTGSRVAEERAWSASVARELAADGHRRAARAARLRLTSRLHAASLLVTALRGRDRRAARDLAAHALR